MTKTHNFPLNSMEALADTALATYPFDGMMAAPESEWVRRKDWQLERAVVLADGEVCKFTVVFNIGQMEIAHCYLAVDSTGEVIRRPKCDVDAANHITNSKAARVNGLKLFVPDLFANKAFLTWLNSSQCMTWHNRNSNLAITDDDYADIAIFIDPSMTGEGSDSDMPFHDEVVSRVKAEIGDGPFPGGHIVVILTNVAD